MATHQTAKTQYVDNGNVKFAYRRFGVCTGVPLLFLIHFRGTMDKWDPILVNSLAATRPVILFDYKGVGKSTGTVPTSFREFGNDVTEFLTLINVEEVDILGFSIGGFVAEMVALNSDPNKVKVRKLVLCGTGASVGPGIENSKNPYLNAAIHEKIGLDQFKELFFSHNAKGAKAAEEWWARVDERNESSCGEQSSNFLSWGHFDGGIGLENQMKSLGLWFEEETSRGVEGSYDRLETLDIPVFIANGSVCFILSKRFFNFHQKRTQTN